MGTVSVRERAVSWNGIVLVTTLAHPGDRQRCRVGEVAIFRRTLVQPAAAAMVDDGAMRASVVPGTKAGMIRLGSFETW